MSTHALAAAVALLVFVAVPSLSARHLHHGSPRLLAAGHLISLTGWAFLPAGWLACAGLELTGLLTSPSPGGCQAGASWFGIQAGPWQLLGTAVVAVVLGPLAWHGLRAVTATRATELRGPALAGARRQSLRDGGSVWILPHPTPLAFASGVLRSRAVVTTGLLDLLDPVEREAVLEHEAAHIRLGHPRLLLLGAVVARAYGFLPPVRRAWAELRRHVEAAADDEAARRVGTAPLLSALARVTLATASSATGWAGFGDAEHLRYRIRRLQQPPHQPAVGINVTIVAAAGLLAGVFAWCACAVIHPQPALPGLALCLGSFAVVASRPLWSRRTTADQAE